MTQLKSVHIMQTTVHSHRADLGWWEVGVAPYQVVQDRMGELDHTAGDSIGICLLYNLKFYSGTPLNRHPLTADIYDITDNSWKS